jgi:hypothetical protein
MGDVSYSIHLIHPLVFVVAKSVTTLAPPIWSQELLPPRHLQHLVRRLGCNLGRSLSAAIQHHRLEQSAALESSYPTHPGRSSFPDPEGPTERASDLAPAPRAVEEPRDVATARWPRKVSAHNHRGARAHRVPRRRVTNRDPWSDVPALCDPARSCTGRVARSHLGIVLPKRIRTDKQDAAAFQISA